MATKRIYIITEGHDVPPQEFFLSIKKLADAEGEELDLSYGAMKQRLQRAKKRTGKSVIKVKDKKGQKFTISVVELEKSEEENKE